MTEQADMRTLQRDGRMKQSLWLCTSLY